MVVTLELIVEMHWPLIGLVLQRLMASGKTQDASFCEVAGSATTSGTGVAEANSRKVLRSVLPSAALTPAQSKPSSTLVGTNGALGVNAMTKLCELKFGGTPGSKPPYWSSPSAHLSRSLWSGRQSSPAPRSPAQSHQLLTSRC
jgi:hypothetical protein